VYSIAGEIDRRSRATLPYPGRPQRYMVIVDLHAACCMRANHAIDDATRIKVTEN
jgi:hypothetical protein